MKVKKNHSEDISNSYSTDNRTEFWFNEIADDPEGFELASDEVAMSLKQEAKTCLDSEILHYNTKNSKSNSDYRWMKIATQKGTFSDKIAASTVLIQDSPVAHLELLRNLVSMVKVSKKNECTTVIDTLTELFITSLLKPNVKLKSFHQRPLTLLTQMSSGNARTRQKILTYWYFEDQLKEIYTGFVLALNKTAQDTLDVNKEKAIGAMYKLLCENSEQEKNLLVYILNKLGDPSQKVASKAIYCLNQLLFKHINMQGVVLNELEKLLFRANVGQKAQYYGICFLSQFYLSHDSADIAKKLIQLYFSFFKACIKKGEVDSRMMSALLMGVNRAYPYAKQELQDISEHIDTLYRVVHVANFNISLHTLMLLHQVSDYTNNRFYAALYKKLNDPKLLTTTHQAMFLNLVYKSLVKDTEGSRIKAFIKRLLQITLYMQPPFACGILYLISQLLSRRADLQATELKEIDVFSLTKFDENEEEKYADIIDNNPVIKAEDDDNDGTNVAVNDVVIKIDDALEEDTKPDIEILNAIMKGGPNFTAKNTIKKDRKDSTVYDPFNRNPLFAGAEHSAYLELLSLKDHFHPTVSLYAKNLLEGIPITYSGDPLKDFSLIRFLDRFVFKNPKKASTEGSHPTFGIRKKYIPNGLRSLALKSEKYLNVNESNIPEDELFLYKYMQKKVSEPKREAEDSDLDSVASEEFEEMLDKMTGNKADEDLDYMNEVGNNLKSKKSKKNASEGSSESEADDDEHNDSDDYSNNESEDLDEIEPDDEDIELMKDLDDDDMSDIEFDSNEDEDKLKRLKSLKKQSDFSSVFASAEEFASILDEEGGNQRAAGGSNAFSNKDNAAGKQIVWEEKRNRWLQGYNKAVGKNRKVEPNERKFNNKRAIKSRPKTKNKKRKV